MEKDPWGMKEASGYASSLTSSPRSKATRMSHTQSDYQLIVAFIKSNLKLFLRLVSTDIHNKEVSLSATEFNTLRILFKVMGNDGRPVDSLERPKSASKASYGKQLSNFAPFFN